MGGRYLGMFPASVTHAKTSSGEAAMTRDCSYACATLRSPLFVRVWGDNPARGPGSEREQGANVHAPDGGRMLRKGAYGEYVHRPAGRPAKTGESP
jgi:hypothetical protein